MSDFLFRGDLKSIDPQVSDVIRMEAERQDRKLIMIPSESSAPQSVRECLGSVFQNLYAEGYPDEETRWMSESELLDFTTRLNHFHRYSDPRYYKGVEFADIIESLARRRCAQLFATKTITADNLFVNVQPLSGAPANNAVYHALIEPGDTIMGMNLLHGGHLTHGSSVNRSGKLYKVIHYSVNSSTEQIDYKSVQKLAQENKPRVIIAGYSSYPWVPEWKIFREIADEIGAYLLADISHIAGLIAAAVVPSPVGFADVITFTTHKTLCGPRGACILTTNEQLSKKIDKAVFPGEQGGPHVNVFAAMSVAFKLAKTDQFKRLQNQIVNNCKALTDRLLERGLRIAFGGTNTHLVNIDCKSIKSSDGTPLTGDMAARFLDIVGIVTNSNTIPGDKSTLKATGIRIGTPWVTQRGLKESDMRRVGDIISDVLFSSQPYQVEGKNSPSIRAKVDFKTLEEAKYKVRELVKKATSDQIISSSGYPFFYFMDDLSQLNQEGFSTLEIKGEKVRQFANFVFTSDIEDLHPGEGQNTSLVTTEGVVEGKIVEVDSNIFHFTFPVSKFGLASSWLRDLSDGYTFFDIDLSRRMPGPIEITEIRSTMPKAINENSNFIFKPFFISIVDGDGDKLPTFKWQEPSELPIRRTPLFEIHKNLAAKLIPFAGWEMPVWYTSVLEEHQAVRQAAGIFDVAHMGVYQAEGPDALCFLDSVCANDIGGLSVGESCYTHFLDPESYVIDDLLVYRHGKEEYLIVVNASNDEKDWAWLNAVIDGNILVDKKRPWTKAFGRKLILHNLRDPKMGKDMRVDLALQGPKSKDILLSLPWDIFNSTNILSLKRTQLCKAKLFEMDMIVSRTGYTGEKNGFELFVHPDHLVKMWNLIFEKGLPLGLKPCGLGARDSLRTEAGLPLYGHEMGGDLQYGVGEAGFSSYVKIYKPWFIGRNSFIEREGKRKGSVVRFRFNDQHVRMAHLGDEVLDEKGNKIGTITSCAIDTQGFLTGQAFVDFKNNNENQVLNIYQQVKKQSDLRNKNIKPGQRSFSPDSAIVVSRFLK
jgi:glycine hydroxymethyltransferase